MAANNALYTPNTFQTTIRRLAHENGWTPQHLTDNQAIFRFDLPSGRSKALMVLAYEHLFEFSVQSAQMFENEDSLPHVMSSFLLQRNCGRSLGFWCLLKIGEQQVYSVMHNVEPRMLSAGYFGDVARILLEEADLLDNFIEDYERKNQVGVVQFGQWRCRADRQTYTDGNRIALVLLDIEDGERIAVATVNAPSIRLAADEVVLKSYEGHEELPNALERAGVVKLTGRTVQMGQHICPIAKCLI